MAVVNVITSGFDPTGQFFAAVSSKFDRHQLHFHSVSTDNLVKTKLVKDFIDFGKHKKVTSLSWIAVETDQNLVEKSSKSKRKRSSSFKKDNNDNLLQKNITSNLIIGFDNGELINYNPFDSSSPIIFKDTKVTKGSKSPISDISPSSTSVNSVWSSNSTSKIIEWDIKTGEIIRKIQTGKKTKIKSLKSILINNEEKLITLCSTVISIIDPANPTKPEIKLAFPISNKITNFSILDDNKSDLIFGTKESSQLISVFSISKQGLSTTLNAQSNILSIIKSATSTSNKNKKNNNNSENQTLVAAITQDSKLEIFDLETNVSFVQLELPQSLVLADAILFSSDEVILAVYDKRQIIVKFSKVSLKQGTKYKSNTIKVSTEHIEEAVSKDAANDTEKDVTSKNVNDNNDVQMKEVSIIEETSDTSSLLLTLTNALKNDNNSLIDSILINQTDESIIKPTILKIESQQAVLLLKILVYKISNDPTNLNTKNLNIWLKYLLIAHAGYLKNSDNKSDLLTVLKPLKDLHSNLVKTQNLLPDILSLQGRFNLLKAQQDLRKNVEKIKTNTSNNKKYNRKEIGKEIGKEIEKENDNVTEEMYINGEVDDIEETFSEDLDENEEEVSNSESEDDDIDEIDEEK